jgi:hypothetical protein
MATPKHDRRIVKHIRELEAAGTDTQKFLAALIAVRDDSALSQAQRGAIHKSVAQSAVIGLRECLSGKELPEELKALIPKRDEPS